MEKIPFSKPSLGQEEIDAMTRVMKSDWLAAGKETELFEEEFADYIGVETGFNRDDHWPHDKIRPYCIFTNSCTSALKMAYKYAKEQGMTKYTCSDNTFCATYSAAEETGLTREGVAFHPNTTVQAIVHFGGMRADNEIKKDAFVIEDSAHRIEPNDPLVGKIRCYSFYATKNMTTGSGGMFVTNDKEIYDKARLWWKDGLSTSTFDRAKGRVGYEVLAMAGGYDGNDIAAAIGRVQLKKLPGFTQRRNQIVRRYNQAFGQDWRGNHLYPYYSGNYRRLLEELPKRGIQVSYFYPGTGPEAVFLPIYPDLTDEQISYIVKTVKELDTK